MPGPFTVTAATNTVQLDAERRGEASFTVFNASGHPIRGRAQIIPEDPVVTPWLGLAGSAERDFDVAEAHQYTVKIAVLPEAPGGSYGLRLDMVGVENPDEAYTRGPTVAFEVPDPAPPKPFPWWIVAVVAAILVIGAIIAVIATRPRAVAVPTVSGATIDEARERLAGVGLEVAEEILTETSGEVAEGRVTRTDPPAGAQVPRGSDDTLVVSSGFGTSFILLRSVEADDGTITGDGTIQAVPCAGQVSVDGGHNRARGFLSYDLSALPADATILGALLDLGTGVREGDPTFERLGALELYHHPYETLDANDLDGEPAALVEAFIPDRPLGTVDVLSLVEARRAAGEERLQFRLQFTQPTSTAGDVQEHTICFEARPPLTVEYEP